MLETHTVLSYKLDLSHQIYVDTPTVLMRKCLDHCKFLLPLYSQVLDLNLTLLTFFFFFFLKPICLIFISVIFVCYDLTVLL